MIKLNKGISTPIAIAIIIVLVLIVGGGILGYQYYYITSKETPKEKLETPKKETPEEEEGDQKEDWSEPVSTEASAVNWPGAVISLDIPNKFIKVKGRSGATITAYVSDKTLLDSLEIGNIVSFEGIYQMRGKYTDNWEVKFTKVDKIILVGDCIAEGQRIEPDLYCCPGLVMVDVSNIITEKYCTKCGDDMCKFPESQENCPTDCVTLNKPFIGSAFIDFDSCDFTNKTFTAEILPNREKFKIMTTTSTKIYVSPENDRPVDRYYSFSEFCGSKPSIPWGYRIKGILVEENTVTAEEIFWFVQ